MSGQQRSSLEWEEIPALTSDGRFGDNGWIEGSFTGVHRNALIMAGGVFTIEPGPAKSNAWQNNIWVLVHENGTYTWYNGGKLHRELAYGTSVSTPEGLLCMGGRDSSAVYDDVFVLQWDPLEKEVNQMLVGKLPQSCAHASATTNNNMVYIAGGQSGIKLSSAMKNFWRADISDLVNGNSYLNWEMLPPWPGPSRAFNITVSQHNGTTNCVYVLSGRRTDKDNEPQFIKDVYEFNPLTYKTSSGKAWQQMKDAPQPMLAGTGIDIGQSHVFILGGGKGGRYDHAMEINRSIPTSPKKSFAFHTITNTWIEAAPIPANEITTKAVRWNDAIIVPDGEINPHTKTPKIWKVEPVTTKANFGLFNLITIVIYLLLMIGVGVFFAFRNESTDDFFRGGQRIPWWAAGLSIFATMLSSLTFIAIPAKAYATDWVQITVNAGIVIVAPFVIQYILPFFRRINATSAYEYLEKRFNATVRLLASASFVFFQIGRMAIVMFLPSLALAAITPLTVEASILIMGVLSIIYCTLGGLEAVIWTDAIQTIILLGGAFLSFGIIIANLDNGFSDFFHTANTYDKLHVINWDWGWQTIATSAFWVVLIGGIAQQFAPYSSDQAVIQRYMSVNSEKNAAKSIWTNAIITIPASLIFFGLGTALFVFYRNFPEKLDPVFQTDAIFPLFIANELPVGIAGIVVAGIFAAAQSTISTGMNSSSTALVTDFVRRFDLLKNEKSYLKLARILTIVLGILGTGFALLLASADIKSLWDTFMRVLGLFGGPLCGVFLLGIFTKKANHFGALTGLFVGIVMVAYIQTFTSVSYLIHTAIGVITCMIAGYMLSFITKTNEKDISGLTVWSLNLKK